MTELSITFDFYKPDYYTDLKRIISTCFDYIEDIYPIEEVDLLSRLYPKGQIICFVNGKLVGANLSRIVPYSKYKYPHTQKMCSDTNLYEYETQIGDSVYGLDVFIDPHYQNLKIGKKIVEYFLQNVFEDNFYCMMGISRITNYSNYISEMDCETYFDKVKNRELKDPVLGFHLSYGAEFVNISPNFCDYDNASSGHGVTIAVYNPNYYRAIRQESGLKSKPISS